MLSQFDSNNFKDFVKLIAPSWLSNLIAIVAGLVLSLGVILAYNFKNSSVQQQLVAWEQTQSKPVLSAAGQTLPAIKPTLHNSWPLLILWAVVGLTVYFIVMALMHSLTNTKQIMSSLKYKNAKPHSILRLSFERILLRVTALVLSLVLVELFIKKVIPYAITAALSGRHGFSDTHHLIYPLLAFIVVVFTIHLITIFLRLASGKLRVFSDPTLT